MSGLFDQDEIPEKQPPLPQKGIQPNLTGLNITESPHTRSAHDPNQRRLAPCKSIVEQSESLF